MPIKSIADADGKPLSDGDWALFGKQSDLDLHCLIHYLPLLNPDNTMIFLKTCADLTLTIPFIGFLLLFH